MSQRECAGFNWPPLAIPAEYPVSICPQAVNRAGVASCACRFRAVSDTPQDPCSAAFRAKNCSGVPPASVSVGVPHPARAFACLQRLAVFWLRPLPCASDACGLTHPVESVADVRGADARSRERHTPDGVAHRFQVSLYKVDPMVDSLACNLLSKNDCRESLSDEPCPGRP